MASAAVIVEIFALIFWSFQLAPQLVKNFQIQSTHGLSSVMILCWSLGSVCTGIYNIGAELSALFIVQPNLFLAFSIAVYTQCHYYDRPKPRRLRAVVIGSSLVLLCAGLETGLSMAIAGCDIDSWPFTLFNVLSLLFFALGFIPQYMEIYSIRGVQGVSLLFMAIDMTGALLSIIALALTDEFQPISGASYIAVFILDGGIVLLSFVLPALLPTVEASSKEQTKETNGVSMLKVISVVNEQ